VPSIRARELHAALVRMGFVPVNKRHVFYFHTIDGRRTGVRTMISHGEDECREPLLHKMARQLYLSRTELDSFVDGGMTPADYTAILRARGVIS
jgi:predicted RNA binding protein YcfA (HicA-like mRNA interferase family)